MVLDIDHMGCGGAVFQFCSLITDDQPHQRYIDEIGPSLTNLNFAVDNVPHAEAQLASEGGCTLTKFHLSLMPWDELLGSGNAKPAEEMSDSIFADTHDQIGFDLEYSETPLKAASWQEGLGTHAARRPDDRIQRLLRLRVMVHDLDGCLDRVQRLFSPASRSGVYHAWSSATAKSARIRLADLELEYCQPLTTEGPWHDYLEQFEQGISAAVFLVKDLKAAVAAMDPEALAQARGEYIADQDPQASAATAYRLNAKDILGFDIELVTALCFNLDQIVETEARMQGAPQHLSPKET
ncbi:hypothetical protein [Denitratisoma oestradiolicum]|uniref:Uncharacterized protein n=1 Tax=Denitratisoma oestradiolicum TaxID=311182 RepID=A0A6S6XYH8_9PROT|nr:hypothetical protein [Denitratisoma oestradiolicum]TWO81230.1 hypothetical protein CBW56_06430 [Denitratisoma oestradiolicum]CAB1367929.1 conserved protein of unknown function [Denitratisoma oestradiolicum]